LHCVERAGLFYIRELGQKHDSSAVLRKSREFILFGVSIGGYSADKPCALSSPAYCNLSGLPQRHFTTPSIIEELVSDDEKQQQQPEVQARWRRSAKLVHLPR